MRRDDDACPCGSGATYATCCAPFHAGAEPPDAERLMRARYAAFARGEHRFLHRTLHRDHEDRARPERDFVASLEKHAKRARYRGLRILDHDGPDADGIARVLFAVDVLVAGRDASFVELSSFAIEGGGWRYVGGRSMPRSAAGDLDALRIATFPL
ncbi:YchJ family protein [Sandaracinus amylolyticus]|uniref:YchJ family protein n=1 Tax=Sandaracinus amylolyticus TaxID=927083 RepID=UPI001F271AE8|nr:YchJ family metal-binding protein [Sandaracinus amylolyticus]UJR85719.1 Hypothetical protein I5071_77990 [Sandaracinus amylolyticus]